MKKKNSVLDSVILGDGMAAVDAAAVAQLRHVVGIHHLAKSLHGICVRGGKAIGCDGVVWVERRVQVRYGGAPYSFILPVAVFAGVRAGDAVVTDGTFAWLTSSPDVRRRLIGGTYPEYPAPTGPLTYTGDVYNPSLLVKARRALGLDEYQPFPVASAGAGSAGVYVLEDGSGMAMVMPMFSNPVDMTAHLAAYVAQDAQKEEVVA